MIEMLAGLLLAAVGAALALAIAGVVSSPMDVSLLGPGTAATLLALGALLAFDAMRRRRRARRKSAGQVVGAPSGVGAGIGVLALAAGLPQADLGLNTLVIGGQPLGFYLASQGLPLVIALIVVLRAAALSAGRT